MIWMEALQSGLAYMESHLLDDISVSDVGKHIGISPFYFQQSFKIITGYTPGEYIRCRRLYLAGLDVIAGQQKIIDIAYKYGYETPESFSKAFTRMHGMSPSRLQSNPYEIHIFQPLHLVVDVKGGHDMRVVFEHKPAIQVIGMISEVEYETAYTTIPQLWSEYRQKCMNEEDKERAVIIENGIGEFGICLDDSDTEGNLRYMIAGMYRGNEVPEGFELYELPERDWAIFPITGPLPEALQTINTAIYKEWIPNHPEVEVIQSITVEWYANAEIDQMDYQSAIWLPIKHKK